jgi:Ca2+/Na+ antiporter
VGNVVGSNIANIGLILGLTALIKPINVDREMFRRDFPFMLVAALLLAVLPFIGGPVAYGDGAGFLLDRWKGVVLLACLGVMLWVMFLGMKSDAPANMPESSKGKRKRNVALALVSSFLLRLPAVKVPSPWLFRMAARWRPPVKPFPSFCRLWTWQSIPKAATSSPACRTASTLKEKRRHKSLPILRASS